jgi:hypothetical protein
MEEFPEVDPRAPRTLPPVPESIDSWGAVRDPRMTAIGEIAPYTIGHGPQSTKNKGGDYASTAE